MVTGATSSQARAFSDPLAFEDPVELGGGAGRWFTGSTAEGYACDVCHLGADGPDVQVSGLPLDGFDPGAVYEITLRWPPAPAHIAAVAELTNDQRASAGTLSLPPPESYTPEDLCSQEEGGFPATALETSSGGRTLATTVECGARAMRLRWTAPATSEGEVWFAAGVTQVDDDDTPAGDGVTVVRHALLPKGADSKSSQLNTGCHASARGDLELDCLALACLLLGWLWLRSPLEQN